MPQNYYFFLSVSKNLFHQMPFACRRQARVGALTLSYIGFPFGLAGQGGQSCHITFPVKVIYCVANHKHMVFKTINLHIKDADLTLAFNDFGPHMGV